MEMTQLQSQVGKKLKACLFTEIQLKVFFQPFTVLLSVNAQYVLISLHARMKDA